MSGAVASDVAASGVAAPVVPAPVVPVPAALADAWRVVLVVSGANVAAAPAALAQLEARSLAADLRILAEDSAPVRAALGALAAPVDYRLPAALPAAAHWTTLLRQMPPSPGMTLLLAAGVQVPQHWDARLVAAAQRAGERAAGVVGLVPLCARHPLLGVLGREPPGLDVEQLDQWLNDYASGTLLPLPLLPQHCLLICAGGAWREALAGAADDRALLAALRRAGHSVAATDQLYVDDSRAACDADLSQLPEPVRAAWLQRSPLLGLRHALSELSGRGEAPPVLRRCLPVQLHVGHSWGGGLARWMEDFLAADSAHNHLVLRSVGDRSAFGQRIVLYRGAAMDVPLASWTLCEPILSVSAGSVEYRALLREIVQRFAVESLVISSLIGHSLDLLHTALPTTFVMHEFFPFCPALYATYDTPCQSCSPERLRACAEHNPHHSYFPYDDDAHWLAVRARFAQAAQRDDVLLVAPNQSVVERYRALEPRLAAKAIHVVPHGLDQALVASLGAVAAAPAAASGRLRIVVLGRLTKEKGGDLLAAACAELGQFADLWLLGCGDSGARFQSRPAVTVVAQYDGAALGELLRGIAPHLGLQLSTVPESFSYTLSELWAAGIPVLATPLGALRERIEATGHGWLVEPEPAALVARLREIDGEREALASLASRIRADRPCPATRMAQRYAALEPRLGFIPLARYDRPRRSWRNPYTDSGQVAARALHVDAQRPYRQVLAEFLLYSAGKMEQSARLPRPAGRLLGRWLRHCARGAAPV